MRIDPLRQFAQLHQQLLAEKVQLEARLAELNRVLGGAETAPASEPQAVAQPKRGRGRGRGSNLMSMREAVLKALSERPLARKEIVSAVEDLGYVFKTRNPLNSIGSILYGKNSPVKSKGGKYYVAGGSSGSAGESNGAASAAKHGRKKKRTMSPEAREKIAAAQRARWAKVKRSK
jgi:hypothetical protein